ncbi:allophanate hydrolase subunit 1 [Haloactinospora alba]|uniref:Allophanate hydrolase subunit 1 n=1 Tax=Haloactinospora alba TaxID=405555 RepID=A0A543N9E5_9ACTN|nr:carboxyltransferase domain-containing protein [Haloactinospora alba]TQN28456.1 allophanate hydrolase subunit 1 [Haloactinospora alba]
MAATATIGVTGPAGGWPAVTYRQAGDQYVMIEYGEHELDLRLNFLVVSVLDRLTTDPPPGLVEAAPGLRSILVRFDPRRTGRDALIERLRATHDAQPDITSLVLPSRVITLPIAFDDTSCREAVRRYVTTIRPDAANTAGGSNIDYIVEQTGFPTAEALYAAVTGTELWTAFTGFAPGLPFLLPLEPGLGLSVPKYNPTRGWTAEGSVGLGGPCAAIYPVESPGSYQLLGRTVPIYDMVGHHPAFATDPFLVRPADRVHFTRVSERELRDARKQVFEGRYRYRIAEEPFSVADHLARWGHDPSRAAGTGAG